MPDFSALYGAIQHLHVQRVADFLDLAALFFAEQLACAADLQVVRCQRKARAEILERFDRLQALDCVGRHHVARRREQVGIRLMMRAADASAQLMQLREAELVRAIDDDRVRGRHVDAALHDRRTHEHIAALMIEVEHDLLELAFAHLSVTDRDPRFRHDFSIARAVFSIVSTLLCTK